MLNKRFEAARLAGRSLLFGADVNDNFLNEVGASRIKAYTGGDLLDLEFKCSNECGTVEGHFNIFITCNSQLHVRLQGDESAWRRRLVVVRYETTFTGRKIVDIEDMLVRQEGPGILNWCIDGAKKLLADIAQHGDLFLSPRQEKIVDDLLSQSDSLRRFLKDKVAKTTHGSGLSSDELFQTYSAFSQRLLAGLRARTSEEEDRGDTFQDHPDDSDPRLSVTLKEPVGEIYALPAPPPEQTSGRCPDITEQPKAPQSPLRATAEAACAPARPDLLDPVVLRTMPPQVAAFMLYEPRDPPPWRRQESEGEREFREQCQSDGAWCG